MLDLMALLRSRSLLLFVVITTILYQLFRTGRFGGEKQKIEALETFNAQCQKYTEPGLEGCGDMWLHEKSGMLYMACGNSKKRLEWFPSEESLNAVHRSLRDRLAVLDTRAKGPLSERLKWITPSDLKGSPPLSLQGFDIKEDSENEGLLHIVLVNHRPSIDASSGNLLDNEEVGANSTLEYFTTKVGESSMAYQKTFSHSTITTPNRVAWLNDFKFAFTNDHSSKVGLARKFIGGGSVGICTRDSDVCTITSTSLSNPTGIITGHRGLIYIASSSKGHIQVFELYSDALGKDTLRKRDTIKIPYPIVNLRMDKMGDLVAATNPTHGGSTIYRLSQLGELNPEVDDGGWGWYILKVLEDPEGKVIEKATVGVYDVVEGRMFMSGYFSQSISICEKMNEVPAEHNHD